MTSISRAALPFAWNFRRGAGWLLLAGALGGLEVLFVSWILLRPGGEVALLYFDDITLTLGASISAVAATAAVMRFGRTKAGFAWALVALGLWMTTLGEAAWGVQELLLGREVPFPSVADAGYLGLYPPVFLGLILMPQAPLTGSRRIKVGLDMVVLMAAVALISWHLILSQLLASGEGSVFQDIVGLAYPFADLVVAFAVFNILFRGGRSPSAMSLVLLAVGFLWIAAADSLYTYATQIGSYGSGSYLDIGWLTGYNLIALAALLSAASPATLVEPAGEDVPTHQSMWPAALSYAPVPALAALVILNHDEAARGTILVGGLLAIVLLAFIRQLITISENDSLTRQLRDLASQLRTKVQTQRLALLRKSDEARKSEELFAKAFHAGPAPLAITRVIDGVFVDVNDAFLRLLEFEREDVIGKDSSELGIRCSGEPGRLGVAGACESYDAIEGTLRTKTGALVEVILSGAPVEVNGEACMFFIGFDVTERHRAEETIRQLAYHDSLTGLPNRELFKDRLRMAINRARRTHEMIAVLFLDLDEFKDVNDTVGHEEGDRLLQFVASRLSSMVRDADTLARSGGDEFTILLSEVSTAEEASAATERILAGLRRRWPVDGHDFRITGSVGVALYPADGEEPDTLLRNADTAMYRAKAAGKDRYELYTPAMNAQIRQRMALESELRHALEAEEFVLYYQPEVEIDSGKIVGAEALMRWNSPTRGLVPPLDFIPIAEASGLIVPIGEWVLRTACGDASAWSREGLGPLRVGVNLSARQFDQKNLIEMVEAALRDSGLDPRCLQLEITERTAINDIELTIHALTQLRAMGVEIAIDDFGTGHSSLSYLRRFPIDVLKIDQSFIRDIGNDRTEEDLVRAIITIGHTLGLKVVAEGVETAEQLAFLKRPEGPSSLGTQMRCDEFQGFLYSRPVPLEAFRRIAAGSEPARE